MTEKGRKIPVEDKEFDTLTSIVVTRGNINSTNILGKPMLETTASKLFANYKESIDWALEAPEYFHHFEIALPEVLVAAYLKEGSEVFDETLVVLLGNTVGESPRSVKEHHGVSTDGSFFDLIIELDKDQFKYFERGLAWLRLEKGDLPPKLTFSLNPGVYTDIEVGEAIRGVMLRTKFVVADLLDGMKN